MSDADDLYLVEPKQFVEARNALAKRLRAEGDKAEAARVAKLRRPSPAAWALDVVAREDAALLDAALAAGAELRRASDKAVGGDPGGLREATAKERKATDAVVDAAARRLGSTRGAAARPELAATLRAAVLDDAVADDLRRGVLVDTHESAGFGFGLDLEPGPAAPRRAKTATKPTPRTKAHGDDAAEKAARAAEAEAAAAAKEAKARAARIAKLEKEVARLEARAERAQAEADEARARADEARRALDEAQR
jgi:hypothetical protein